MLLRQTKEKKTEIKERNKEAKKKWLLKQPEEKKMVNRLKTFGNVEMLYSIDVTSRYLLLLEAGNP